MRRYKIEVKGKQYLIYIQEMSSTRFRAMVNDQALDVQILDDQDLAEARITPEVGAARAGEAIVVEQPSTTVATPRPDLPEKLSAPPPPQPPKPVLPTDAPRADVTAPMPGVISSIEVKPGDMVERGQTVVTLEAMKMKNAIKSPSPGKVAEVLVSAGQQVGYGDVLVRFEEAAP